MPITVTHTFVSAIADDPAAVAVGTVLPSHWNAQHTVTGVATLISRQTVGSAVATVTFSSIPQTYTNLIYTVMGADASASGTEVLFRVLCNGDTTAANYTVSEVQAVNGAAGTAGTAPAATSAGGIAGMIAGRQLLATSVGVTRGDILGYAQAQFNKIVRAASATNYTTGGLAITITNTAFGWLSPAAITSLTFTAGGTLFVPNTTIALFGEP